MFSFNNHEEYVLAACVANFIVHIAILQTRKDNGKLTVLIDKGDVCLFHKNLREVHVRFKTKGGVIDILINLRGGECNFPFFFMRQDINDGSTGINRAFEA